MKALYMANQILMTSRFVYIYCKNLDSVTHKENDKFLMVTVWQKAKEWFMEKGSKDSIQQLARYIDMKIADRMLIYIKHYVQKGHGKTEMFEELKRIGGYDMIMHDGYQLMPYRKEELDSLQNNPDKFIRKTRLEGWKIKYGQIALKIGFIRRCRDKKIYPLTKI